MDGQLHIGDSLVISDKPNKIHELVNSLKNPKDLDILHQTAQYLVTNQEIRTVMYKNVVIYKHEYGPADGWTGYYHSTKDKACHGVAEGQRHGATYYKHLDGREIYYIYDLGVKMEITKIKGDIKWITKHEMGSPRDIYETYFKNRLMYREGCTNGNYIDNIQIYDKITSILTAEYHANNNKFIIYNVNKYILCNIIAQIGDHADMDISHCRNSSAEGNIVSGRLQDKGNTLAIDREKVSAFIKSLNPMKDEIY